MSASSPVGAARFPTNSTASTARNQSFSYDGLNRVTQASSGTAWGSTFTYDAWGNLYQTGSVAGTSINPMTVNQQMTLTTNQFALLGYVYDAAGNVLADGINTGCGSYSYSWNAEERMSCAAGSTYTYDGDGARVEKTGGNAVTTLYWSTLAESGTNGTVTSEYIFAGSKRIARRDVSTGSVYYYFEDMLGSSNVVATSTGALENESDFYPFGGEDPITQNLTNQKFKFTGKERDPETGLDDFEARYYNSNMGRFQSPDWANKQEPVPYAKLWNPQTLNLYAYVGNNPESSPDLDGHEGPDPDPDPFGASVSSDIFADPASSGPAPSQGTVGAPILQSGQQTQKQSTDQTQQAQQQKYDPSKTGPEDPTNPGHPLSQNSIVKKASDKAFMQTTNGQAGNGLAEAGFSIEYKDGKLSTANWTSSVNADGTLNQLSIKTDDNTIAILHTHGNKAIPTPSLPDKSRGTPGDVASRFPNFVRSASHLYVTVPGTTTWTDLGNP